MSKAWSPISSAAAFLPWWRSKMGWLSPSAGKGAAGRLAPDVGLAAPEGTLLRSYVLLGLLASLLGWLATAEAIIHVGGYVMGLWPGAWRYADTGLPMISTADGFFFISQANVALDSGFAGLPPFSLLTAVLSKVTFSSVEGVAFWLSLAVQLGLGLIMAVWARTLNMGRMTAFLAAFAAALIPAWVERGGPGQYDTDLVIQALLQLSLLLMVKAELGLKESNRPFWLLVAALASFALLYWFWPSAIGLALPAVALWLLFFLPLRVVGIKPRLVAAGLLAVWGALVLFLPEHAPAPQFIVSFIHDKLAAYLGIHSATVINRIQSYGIESDLFYGSINELRTVPWDALLRELGGSVAGGVAMLVAAALAVWRCPALRFPVLFSLFYVALGTRSQRLIYLGFFPLTVALGLLPRLVADSVATGRARFPRVKPRLVQAAGFLVVLGVIASCLLWRVSYGLDIRWENTHDRVLEPLREELAGQEAYMFNWWDDGYFLMARLGPHVHANYNGGVPNPLTGYALGHGLDMEDHELAARWMRFFAVHGNDGILPLIKVWGEEDAWRNLEKVLAGVDVDGLEEVEGGLDWFFPKGRVYWYMPSYFLSLSHWWLPLGLSRDPDEKLVRKHIDIIRREEFAYNPETQELTVTQELWDKGYKDFGLVINADETPLAEPWPTAKAPYIVWSSQNPYAYITDQLGIKTLPLYMAVPGGPVPEKFRLVVEDREWGTIWELLE